MPPPPRNLSRLNILGILMALGGAFQFVVGLFFDPAALRLLFVVAAGVQVAAGLALAFHRGVGGGRER